MVFVFLVLLERLSSSSKERSLSLALTWVFMHSNLQFGKHSKQLYCLPLKLEVLYLAKQKLEVLFRFSMFSFFMFLCFGVGSHVESPYCSSFSFFFF